MVTPRQRTGTLVFSNNIKKGISDITDINLTVSTINVWLYYLPYSGEYYHYCTH